MNYALSFNIGSTPISIASPTYFIADIGANHDGDLERAKDLIWLSKEAGANCAKFQHFVANKIVSNVGFGAMRSRLSHQASWRKSVAEVYDQYHAKREWTQDLIDTCEKAKIDFMTTPYDTEAIELFKDTIPAYKIGSGDITFHTAIERIAKIGKPVLLATGAADMNDVEAAVRIVLEHNDKLCLLQCNTNYTGSYDNFRYVNLRTILSFLQKWPGIPVGFSDHTPGHSAVLGAIALGARVVEKHFTDDNNREGPDHSFALNPVTWRAMIDASRELEASLGDGVKRVEPNEEDTVIIQRRALRAIGNLEKGTVLEEHHLQALRPCPADAISPDRLREVLGRRLAVAKGAEEALLWSDLIP